tara:strand:+ start:450 stop:566 length:117 start_codon:yes stop_codon:yes gene_type:complete
MTQAARYMGDRRFELGEAPALDLRAGVTISVMGMKPNP